MNIAFRVDSSLSIGLGHVARCITLANEFKKKNCKVIFISKELENFSKQILKKRKIKYFLIKKDLSQKNDSKETLKILKKNGVDLIFLDNYSLGLNWEKKIRKKTKLALIDDYYNRRSIADFYINYHCYLYGNKFSKLKNYCKKFIGLEYAILKKKKNIKKNSKQVLIYFGSVDSKKYSIKLLEIFKKKNLKTIILKFTQIKT